MILSNYPPGSMMGSGIYSYDEDIILPTTCECGSDDGVRFTDDWGIVTITCAECEAEQAVPEADEYDGPDDFDYADEAEANWQADRAEDAWLDSLGD